MAGNNFLQWTVKIWSYGHEHGTTQQPNFGEVNNNSFLFLNMEMYWDDEAEPSVSVPEPEVVLEPLIDFSKLLPPTAEVRLPGDLEAPRTVTVRLRVSGGSGAVGAEAMTAFTTGVTSPSTGRRTRANWVPPTLFSASRRMA